MRKYNIVLAEKDSMYLDNLMNYISQKYSHKFNTICFTNENYLEDHLKKSDKVDILLIGADFYSENIANTNKVIIILSDNVLGNEEIPCIKKYQSAEKICTDVIKIYEANKISNEENDMVGTKFVTFYSPLGGSGTSTLATSCAYSLAQRNKKVLYLSLENTQSTGIFFNEEKSKYNLSDLIMSIKDRSGDFKDILSNGIKKHEDTSLYYLNSVDSMLDIEELLLEDIKELVENIQQTNMFDFVIFDIPSMLHTKYYYILKKSVSVFVIIGQDKRSNYKTDTVLRQLDNIDNFRFIVNKFNNSKERLVPKLVANSIRPIIETFNFYLSIEENYNLKEYGNVCEEFKGKVDEIVLNNILI